MKWLIFTETAWSSQVKKGPEFFLLNKEEKGCVIFLKMKKGDWKKLGKACLREQK